MTIQIYINQQPTQLPADSRLLQAVKQSNAIEPFAVALNDNFVPKSQYDHQALTNGDRIEILSPIQGG